MPTLNDQVDAFVTSVGSLKQLRTDITKDLADWEHTLKGKSELSDEKKKELRSAISSAKRQLGLVKPRGTDEQVSA